MGSSFHDAMFDLHVSRQISFQGEFAGAVQALEGLAVGMQVHVAHQIVHPVKLLPTELETMKNHH